MQKIKTAFFWRIFIFSAIGFLVMSVLMNLFFKEGFQMFWIRVVIQAFFFASITAFLTKPKPKRITDFNVVK